MTPRPIHEPPPAAPPCHHDCSILRLWMTNGGHVTSTSPLRQPHHAIMTCSIFLAFSSPPLGHERIGLFQGSHPGLKKVRLVNLPECSDDPLAHRLMAAGAVGQISQDVRRSRPSPRGLLIPGRSVRLEWFVHEEETVLAH